MSICLESAQAYPVTKWEEERYFKIHEDGNTDIDDEVLDIDVAREMLKETLERRL